eukprot:gb/GECG01005049.1/.p1 GENE.gb/GECG01005049.1/~~gb/GECG01005049.1/.p1  ORF type:complete len:1131 (+),score=192.85 gb/GECG01005049.1/:1-3393(+)
MSSSDSPSNLAQGDPRASGKGAQENAKPGHSSTTNHKLRFSGLNKGLNQHRNEEKGTSKPYKKQKKPSPTSHQQKSKVTQTRRDTLRALAKQPPRLKEGTKATAYTTSSQASLSTNTSPAEEQQQQTPTIPQVQSASATNSNAQALDVPLQRGPPQTKSPPTDSTNAHNGSDFAIHSTVSPASSGASELDRVAKHQSAHHPSTAATTIFQSARSGLSCRTNGTTTQVPGSPTRRPQTKTRKMEEDVTFASAGSTTITGTEDRQSEVFPQATCGELGGSISETTDAHSVRQKDNNQTKRKKKANSGQTSKVDTPSVFSQSSASSSTRPTYASIVSSQATATRAAQSADLSLPSSSSANPKARKKRDRKETGTNASAVSQETPNRLQLQTDTNISPKKSRKTSQTETPETSSVSQLSAVDAETESSEQAVTASSGSATIVAVSGSSYSSQPEQSSQHEDISLKSYMQSMSIELSKEAAEGLRKKAEELWSSHTVCGQLFAWAIFALLKEAPLFEKNKKKKSKRTIKKVYDVHCAIDILDTIKETERKLYGTQGVSTENIQESSEPKKKRVRFCTYDFTTVDSCPSDVGSEYWMKAIVQHEQEKPSKDMDEYALLPCLAKPTKQEKDDTPEISIDVDTDIPVRTPMEVLLEYLRKIGQQAIHLADVEGESGRFFLCFYRALKQIAGLNRNKGYDVNMEADERNVCTDTILRKAAEQYLYEFGGLKRFLNGEGTKEICKIVPFKFQISACISSVMRFHMRRVFNPHAEFIVDDDDDDENTQNDDTSSETGWTFSFTSSARGIGRGGGADVEGFISIDEECMTLKYNIDDLAAVVNRAMWTVCEYSGTASSVLEAGSSRNAFEMPAEELHKAVGAAPVSSIFELLEYAQSAMFVKQLFAHPAVKTAANTERSSWERLRTLSKYIEELGSESENYLLPFKDLNHFVKGLPEEDTLASLVQSAEKVRKKHLKSLNQLKKKLRRRSRRDSRGKLGEDGKSSSGEENNDNKELTAHQRALLENEDLLSLESLFQYPSLVYVSPSLSTGEEVETQQVFDSPALDPDEKLEPQTTDLESHDTVQVDNSSVAELTSEAFGFSEQAHENLSEPESESMESPSFTGALPLDDTPVKSQNPYWNL